MKMYYIQGNYILAHKYSIDSKKIQNNTLINVSSDLGDSQTIFVSNSKTNSDMSKLSSSKDFGYDMDVFQHNPYEPTYILYNKLY